MLFVLPSLGSLRYFQSVLEALTARGHTVRLLLESAGYGDVHAVWLERMLRRPNFHCETSDLKRDPWHKRGSALRRALEYAQFLGPAYEGRPNRLQALRRPPGPAIRRLTRLPLLGSPRGLRVLRSALAAIERALPEPARAVEHLRQLRPDVIALGDYSSRTSLYPVFSRTATREGIPTAACVRSWDNLSTRPRMTAVPHAVLVWNETQLREAVELHDVPPGGSSSQARRTSTTGSDGSRDRGRSFCAASASIPRGR